MLNCELEINLVELFPSLPVPTANELRRGDI